MQDSYIRRCYFALHFCLYIQEVAKKGDFCNLKVGFYFKCFVLRGQEMLLILLILQCAIRTAFCETLSCEHYLSRRVAGVFHYDRNIRYNLTFQEAKEACEKDFAASLADRMQLFTAYQQGLEECRAGWISSAEVAYPRVHKNWNCGQNHTGIITYGIRENLLERWDVFCYKEDNNCSVYPTFFPTAQSSAASENAEIQNVSGGYFTITSTLRRRKTGTKTADTGNSWTRRDPKGFNNNSPVTTTLNGMRSGSSESSNGLTRARDGPFNIPDDGNQEMASSIKERQTMEPLLQDAITGAAEVEQATEGFEILSSKMPGSPLFSVQLKTTPHNAVPESKITDVKLVGPFRTVSASFVSDSLMSHALPLPTQGLYKQDNAEQTQGDNIDIIHPSSRKDINQSTYTTTTMFSMSSYQPNTSPELREVTSAAVSNERQTTETYTNRQEAFSERSLFEFVKPTKTPVFKLTTAGHLKDRMAGSRTISQNLESEHTQKTGNAHGNEASTEELQMKELHVTATSPSYPRSHDPVQDLNSATDQPDHPEKTPVTVLTDTGRQHEATTVIGSSEVPPVSCGGVLQGDKGEFQSPGFPQSYPSNMDCTWEVTAPPGHLILLAFHSMALEEHKGCQYDFITVFDGKREEGVELGRFCGSQLPPPLRSSSNTMTVQLRSDASVELDGFSVRFHSVKPPSSLPGRVRLRGGRNRFEGLVEMAFGGALGRVCAEQWEKREATVVCRQLGFPGAAIAYRVQSQARDPPVTVSYVECSGDESSLDECEVKWGRECSTTERAAVHCQVMETCSILRSAGVLESGTYVIDPDGEDQGVEPFPVFCDMNSLRADGVTVVGHDSESRTRVSPCEKAGCYSRHITYRQASLLQLRSLIQASESCTQLVKLECRHTRFLGEEWGWWVSWDGRRMNSWGGTSTDSKKCACGERGDCDLGLLTCNCDANDEVWRSDEGYLSDKASLPMREVRLGDTQDMPMEMAFHTIGKLFCTGQSITVVSHNSGHRMRVAPCEEKGCYRKELQYEADLPQLHALTQVSRSCQQYVKVSWEQRAGEKTAAQLLKRLL
nr:PREDICTED: uncharacterized protein LOC107078240 [Lepisosteus oculatus]